MRKAQNVGTAERWLRIIGGGLAALVGLVLLLPAPASIGAGALGVALVLLGLDFVYTGITGYCPLYNRLGWSTTRGGGSHLMKPPLTPYISERNVCYVPP